MSMLLLVLLMALSTTDENPTVLMNIGTAKASQQRGAATALVKQTFDAADREQVAIYLDTDSDGAAKRLFDKLGFEEVGKFEIDLSKHGGQGWHSHVGMIRRPLSGGVTRVEEEGAVV